MMMEQRWISKLAIERTNRLRLLDHNNHNQGQVDKVVQDARAVAGMDAGWTVPVISAEQAQ